jgi:hypothetical protein
VSPRGLIAAAWARRPRLNTVHPERKNIKQAIKIKNMTYSSTLSMGRQRFVRRNQNSVTFAVESKRLGPISNAIVLIVLACLLGLVYLTQVTKSRAYSYQINKLQVKQSSLKNERDELEVASARLQALDALKNTPQAQALVSVAPTATIQN